MPRRDRDLARIARHRLTALAVPRSPGRPPAPGWVPPQPVTPVRGIDLSATRADTPPDRGEPPATAPSRPGSRPPLDPSSPADGPGVVPRAPATSRTAQALEVAAAGYTTAHGDPTSRAPALRRRVRWAVPWRLAAAAGAVVLLVAGAVALRAAAEAPGPPVALPTPASSGPLAVASPTATADVVVDVVGAVITPGVVRLAPGSRVVDAIAAAGGPAADAQVSALNLARVLVDGEQIAVPRPGDAPASAGPAGTDGGADLVDLNNADPAALDALPGIGPVLADRIVAHRQDAPFTTVDELADVAGIGPTLMERLRDLVRV